MAFDVKTDQNTPVSDINTITNPNTKTLVDRYVFASNFCKGKSVLDCACGWGYGSTILKAMGADVVFGLDIDTSAIEYAKKHYETSSVKFGNTDITIPFETSGMDVIVSIETFEHVPRESVTQMLTNFRNACKPGGLIIITTPHRKTDVFNYIPGSTHLYEYTIGEFIEEISKVFTTFELWYAVEFNYPASPELNTVFTPDANYADQAAVMVAIIKNDKSL